MDSTDLVERTGNMSLNSGNVQEKRNNYLEWRDYFMAVAMLSAQRSKDPCYQVGACVVNSDNQIVGVGYNGMPIGCSDDDFPWGKKTISPLDSKFLYVCHAEMNAIMNKNSSNLRDCTIYVTLFPCNECAKIIIQSRIKEVIYLSDKNSHKDDNIAAKRMFDAAEVKYWQFTPSQTEIVINLSIDKEHHKKRQKLK